MVVEVVLLFARASTGAMSFADRAMGLRRESRNGKRVSTRQSRTIDRQNSCPKMPEKRERRERGLS